MKVKLLSYKEMQAKKPAEIKAYAADLKLKHSELIKELHTNKAKDTHNLSAMKKSIARALTTLKESEKEK